MNVDTPVLDIDTNVNDDDDDDNEPCPFYLLKVEAVQRYPFEFVLQHVSDVSETSLPNG
jgi:hypothetical protein